MKEFRESQKQELRLLKQEVDLMPKDKRKSTFKQRKEKLEAEHEEREKAFLVKLNENHESSLRRLSDSHRERIALRERQYLQQKQQVCNYLLLHLSECASSFLHLRGVRGCVFFFLVSRKHVLLFYVNCFSAHACS